MFTYSWYGKVVNACSSHKKHKNNSTYLFFLLESPILTCLICKSDFSKFQMYVSRNKYYSMHFKYAFYVHKSIYKWAKVLTQL